MKTLLLILTCAAGMMAQSFPSAIYTPLIAKDNISSTLSAPMAIGDTVAVVASSTGWVTNMVGYICDSTTSTTKCTGTFEAMKVTNVAGNVLTVTRAFGGTSAVAHSSGKVFSNSPTSIYNKTLNDEVLAIETALGTNMGNIPVIPAGTPPQVLRLKPNVVSQSTLEFSNPALVNARDYNYPAQTPGGSLTASVGASVTLTPCPLGVIGTDTRLRFYISAGTGTAESVASTGAGTCTSGAATGTVTFTPANNHSGAWTIQSSHAGIYEAIAANPFREVRIPKGTYTMHDCLNFNQNQSLILSGDSYDPAGATGTILDFTPITTTSCAAAIVESDGTGYPIWPVTLRNLLVVGNGATTPLWAGLSFTNVTRVTLDHVMVSGFASYGVVTTNSFEVTLDSCNIQYSGRWGVLINGTSNLVRVTNNYFSYNGRSNGYGNLAITGNAAPAISTPVLVEGNALEVAGASPFTAVTVSFGAYFSNISSLTFRGNYLEANVGGSPNAQVVYGPGITSLIETGNLFSSAGTSALLAVDYGSPTTTIKSFGNTFYGATALRYFEGTDFSGYDIGPDACFATSTECTDHPRYLGNVTKMSTTGAVTAALTANYIATESGSNNAIAGALVDQTGTAVPLAAGLKVVVKLAHTLQAGANTFVFNTVSKNIKSARNPANNIGTAWASGGIITLAYDGTQFLDVSQ